ncbi:MAG: hypothetical protein HONBIEJF_02334 [Fimbriimonadaceae bacterium]|nr:hypothetical protein [Fimbriimonadaceae bacterium]
MAVAASASGAIGRYKFENGKNVDKDIELPLEIFNSAVRIGDSGSGVVYRLKLDDPGNKDSAGWMCVLTADHVSGMKVGFGNAGGGGLSLDATIRIDGPKTGKKDGKDTFLDLAMLGVRFKKLSELPKLGNHVISKLDKDVRVVQAGFGPGASVDYIAGAYYSDEKYGTYRSWDNAKTSINPAYDRTKKDGTKTYQFVGLEGRLYFTRDGRNRYGSSYLFPGDSGGPTFQLVGDSWKLVGVHSGAQFFKDDGGHEYVPSGSVWTDVHLADYNDWIMKSCDAVPEPATIATLACGFAALRLRRRRT